MQKPTAAIRVGALVRIRGERWRITAVRASNDDGPSIVTVAGAGAMNGADTRSFLSPFDVVDAEGATGRPRIVSIQRWRAALRDTLRERLTYSSAGALRAAADARIDLLPHQLEPALAIASGRGTRVLIADEVGLGKTIQAALILAELSERGASDHALILTPAGVRAQWARELSDRFGIDAVIMDTREGRRRAGSLPVGTNPWVTVPVAISSIDYVKRPEVAAAVCASRWDVVVVDEAHGATPASDRREALQSICRRAAYVILLTATPHNGDARAFEALCRLGSIHEADDLLIFRRSRGEISVGAGRRVHKLFVSPTGSERRVHRALDDLARAIGSRTTSVDARLALGVLQKRAWSSAHSLRESVGRRLTSLAGAPGSVGLQLSLPLDDTAGDTDAADSAPTFSTPLLDDETRERALLQGMFEAAAGAVPDQSKVSALRRLLRRLDALGEKAIVFTEYRDTLLHLRECIRRPCVLIHGGMPLDERMAAVDAFTRGRAGLLLATDAAGEGLNLQSSCRVIVNLELPWNPMRLEQRIGRVDRIGQARRVHVFHLIARDTPEVGILARLSDRLSRAAHDIGASDPLGLGGSDDPSPPALTIRLASEAAAEHARLTASRALAVPHRPGTPCAIPNADVVAAFARRQSLRTALAGQSIALIRGAVVDAGGRPLSVALVPLGFIRTCRHGSGPVMARAALDAVLAACPSFAGDLQRLEADGTHHAFWSCRLARERAVATPHDSTLVLQCGLFDLRAERNVRDRLDAERLYALECEFRIAAAERALNVEVEPFRPALLLLL